MEDLDRVQVRHSDDGPSTLQITFRVGRSGPEDPIDFGQLFNPLLSPMNRIVVAVTFGVLPQVLFDGFITHRELQPGDERRGGDFETWFWIEERETPVEGFDFTAVPVVFGQVRDVGGFVRDASGSPVERVTVTLRSLSDQNFPLRDERTNTQGGYQFAQVPPGRYVAAVTFRNGQTLEREVTMPTSPNNPPFEPGDVPIGGIGPVLGNRLVEANVRSVAALALTPPARLAEILNVSQGQARRFIARAVARLRGEE